MRALITFVLLICLASFAHGKTAPKKKPAKRAAVSKAAPAKNAAARKIASKDEPKDAAKETPKEAPKENFKKRCGWLDNPSPGNWFFDDKEGSWTISEQGMYEAKGVDSLPQIDEKEKEFTNSGGYGYGCACLEVSVEDSEKKIVSIRSGKAQPLKQCKSDKTLPLKASGV